MKATFGLYPQKVMFQRPYVGNSENKICVIKSRSTKSIVRETTEVNTISVKPLSDSQEICRFYGY